MAAKKVNTSKETPPNPPKCFPRNSWDVQEARGAAAVGCIAFVLSPRTGGDLVLPDISLLSSPIGMVCCTACVVSHGMGRGPEPLDVSWPSSFIGNVCCTAFEEGGEDRKQGRREDVRGKSDNHHTDAGETERT